MYRCILDPRKLTSSIGLLNTVLAHTKTCPTRHKKPTCEGSGIKGGGTGPGKRAVTSGPCRFGFVPDEWFTFFYSQTGVSGPYIFGIVLGNYLLSKEIYIMEHDYYCGLSIGLMCYFVVTRFGPAIGKTLDRQVDAIEAEYNKTRTDEISVYEITIKSATQLKEIAKGQELLMLAKKENVKMQLEAVYRERVMHVYRSVKGRLDYHTKRHRAESRIHQKWIIQWILDKVMKSITPEFEKQALDSAIRDLVAVAGRNA